MASHLSRLARRARELRVARGMRRHELAVATKLGTATIERIERDVCTPTRATVRAIETALDAEPGALESLLVRVR